MKERVGDRFHGLGPLVAFALLLGIVLRLAFAHDIQYLGDEAWTFRHVDDARNGLPWATLGMPSSRGVQNAGMSVWVFIFLGTIGQASTPAGLTRCVAVAAILANVLMLAIPLYLLKDEKERKAWLWAFVLCATNPILVFIERKIWAQSVLPVFQVAMIIAWMRREKHAGAFVWGLIGALVGQIHMAGFFFVPALAGFTRLRSPPGRTRWLSWFLGSAVGALPALPWMLYLLHDRPPAAPSAWWLRFRLEFYQYFFSDPSGLCSSYIVERDWGALMRYPTIGGHPTYLVAVAHLVLAVATGVIAYRALSYGWARRREPKELVLGDRSDTGILVASALVGMGALMTLPSISIHRHYMLALFPLPYVWTARAALRGPDAGRWLGMLFGGTLVVSIGLLSFIEVNGGADGFGMSLSRQEDLGIPPEAAKDFRPQAAP